MLNLELYVHGAAMIAPEAEPATAPERLSAAEPDYSSLIQPMQLRRMSKAVRMGIGAASQCLQSAGTNLADAIAVGTTMGCLQDTEVFLKKMLEQEERMLTPTAFIQSTHNTIAGQIALITNCMGYNTTVSQHGHSFEGAVVASSLYLGENPGHNVLCGGVDELTDTSFQLMQRAGVYANNDQKQPGAIAGEGAGFLMLNKKAESSKCCIKGMHAFSEKNVDAVVAQIENILDAAGGLADEDVLLLGSSGDQASFPVYQALNARYNGSPVIFKEKCGEWGTVIATAVSRAVLEWPAPARRIWIINHYCIDWSVWLLKR